MNLKNMSALIAFALIFVGCGPSASSQLDGHYEASSAAEMEPFALGQRAVAEHEESRGVIIGLPLITSMHKENMARAILGAVNQLWITVNADYKGDLSGRDFDTLRQVLGNDMQRVQLVRQQDQGVLSIWARDWAPLGAKASDGSLRLLDFNYYRDRGADDATARSLSALLPEAKRVSVPVYNEGGNFMNNTRGLCLMTTRVTDANAVAERDDDQVLNAAQIKDYYRTFAGCAQTVIFPRMPYEGTGHIDMWAKFLSDDTVIVAQLRDEIVNLPNYSATQKSKVANLQKYLETRAAEVSALGLTVVRVPMPAPVFSKEGDVFRSYTNSLTVNGVVLVPRYVYPAFDDIAVAGQYLDQSFLAAYETEAAAAYRGLGYQVKWIDSDDLIAIGGAVHCTTMQIAR